MITLPRIHRLLIACFVFFGPLGTLLTPSFLPYAFRFYHFFLVLSPFFFVNLKEREWKTVFAFVPFLAYCLISAYLTHNKPFHVDAYPLLRCFLFTSQCLFVFGAAFALRGEDQREVKGKLIRLYLIGFAISLIIGYIFYIGFYTHKISFETIYKYSVEAQMGWGLLRFSPGTYPNEYGNISSFALSILLLLFARKKRFWIFFFAFLTFVAFLLTTTRAAYLSFLVTLAYLCITSKAIRALMTKFFLIILSLLLILKAYSIDFFHIFVSGVRTISFTYGTTGIRFKEWIKGFEDLDSTVIFGNGFGANILVHNVYLELLFELGLVGAILLVVTLFYYFSENGHKIRSLFFRHAMDKEDRFYNRVVIVGLIHIALFAATNHNMHHHLTWFIFLLFNMSLFSKERKVQEDALALSSMQQQLSPQP